MALPRTPLSIAAATAVDAFGSIVRVAILAFLRTHGQAGRGELASGLSLDVQTVQLHLGHLRRLGLVTAEQVRASGTDRHRLLYVADAARTRELLHALTAELTGELADDEPPGDPIGV